MKNIKPGFLLPSAAYTVSPSQIRHVSRLEKPPAIGDIIFGTVDYIGQYSNLENKQGRIHNIHSGTKAAFVFGNRYAPDFYEAIIPDHLPAEVDLVARSGLVARMHCKSASVKDPTRIRVHGYVCTPEGEVLNTTHFSKIHPKKVVKAHQRAKLILSIGTAMNSGKSRSAAACAWALTTMGYAVRAAKITGTASLKDILLFEDSGAKPIADFTFLGYPSTYLLSEPELLSIFHTLDLKYANNPKNFWIVEIADGIFQRETAILLHHSEVRSRIHRLILSAHDACGAVGALETLKDSFNLAPDAISGVCTGSPLGIRELSAQTDLPVFNNFEPDLKQMAEILL